MTSASVMLYGATNAGQDVTCSGTAESDATLVTVTLNGSVSASVVLLTSGSQQSWSVAFAAATFATVPDGAVVAAAVVSTPGGDVSAGTLTITKDANPTGPITMFSAVGGTGQISLSWTNPTDSDFVATRVLQSPTGIASSPIPAGDQTIVFDGSGTTAVASGLTAGTTYFYTAFAGDVGGNWSALASAQGTVNSTPPPPPPPPPPVMASFSDSFANCTSTNNLGPNWTIVGTWYCRSAKARGESASSVALANTVAMSGTDVSARVQLSSLTLGNGGVAARALGGSFYAARILINGTVEVIRVNGSTVTSLGHVAAKISPEPASYKLRLRVSGTSTVQLDVWLAGVQVLSVQDSSTQALASGQAGLYNGNAARSQFDGFSVVSF